MKLIAWENFKSFTFVIVTNKKLQQYKLNINATGL